MKPEIVFIDDDANLLASLRRRLFRFASEWDLAFYSDIDAAMEHLGSKTVDALVCDIKMPGTSGLDLIQRITAIEKNQNLPIVMMSGVDDEQLKCKSIEHGAIDLMSKPIDFDELLTRLRSMVKTRVVRMVPVDSPRLPEKGCDINPEDLDYLSCLYRIAKQYDSDADEHIARVGWYSREIASAMGLNNRFVEDLFWAAPLHDIGKVGVPSEILRKKGNLSAGEMAVMQNHCAIGELMLRGRSTDVMNLHEADNSTEMLRFGENPILSMAASIALTHHERWDGSGYPMGLVGEKIPLESCIVGLADVFDAGNDCRESYRDNDPVEMRQWVVEQRGKLFHPDAVDAFDAIYDHIMTIREVLMHEEPMFASGSEM